MTPDDNYCFTIVAQENLLVDTNIMFLADLDALICRNIAFSSGHFEFQYGPSSVKHLYPSSVLHAFVSLTMAFGSNDVK